MTTIGSTDMDWIDEMKIREQKENSVVDEITSEEEKLSYIGRIKSLEHNIEDINKFLNNKKRVALELDMEKNTYKEQIDSLSDAKSQKRLDIMEKIKKCKKEEKEVYESIVIVMDLQKKFQEDRNNLAHKLGGKRYVDKETILSNVKRIAKEKNVKIGDIENDSGNSIGYMARLSKANSLALPNTDFIITASKLLNVSLDEILKKPSKPFNSKEQIIDEFSKKIYKLTEEEKINWGKTSKERFQGYSGSKKSTKYPLAEIDVGEYVDSYGDISTGLIEVYKSSFGESGYVDLEGDIAFASFDESGNKIYIAPVKYRKDNKTPSEKVIYEIYITDKNDKNIKPLCNTENVIDEIETIVEKLYKEAVMKSTNINVDEDTESILKSFLEEWKTAKNYLAAHIDSKCVALDYPRKLSLTQTVAFCK